MYIAVPKPERKADQLLCPVVSTNYAQKLASLSALAGCTLLPNCL